VIFLSSIRALGRCPKKVQIQDQKEAGDPNFGLSETNLKAIISKTANRIKVSCQLGLKLSAKRAFQKCKLRGDYA